MRVWPIAVIVVAGAALAAPRATVAPAPRLPAPAVDPHELRGWPVYERYCLACHGAKGDGRGPAAAFTRGRPRAFTSGNYEWRSTALGEPPTDDDLRAALRYGAPGTSMPAFDGILDADDLERVIEVVKAFAPATFAHAGAPVALGPPRTPDDARGSYLWTQLGCDKCHGARGKGDGPSAKALADPPYDLTGEPLRRPRATDTLADRRRAAALAIATGMAGTAMPGYAGQVPDADLWALADHVVALGPREVRAPRIGVLDDEAIAADRAAPMLVGTWPGARDDDDAKIFGAPVPAQGAPPASLAPAEASLRSAQCGRCHAKQLREWRGSLHAAATAGGLAARVHGLPADDTASCARCHTPLAEQHTDEDLHGEGVTCAGCHVRDWVRHGPPRVATSLVTVDSYPMQVQGIYERADLCVACHQLPPRTAVAGKPLLDTYAEWLDGPYARRGIQCQHCHMPNREHQWLGVHDRDTFRQGIRLDASAHVAGGAVTVLAELRNLGAGHMLPTTPTPAAWLRVELYDARGRAIEGARAEQRIGRDIELDERGAWHERADTRIAPGATLALARAWRGGRVAQAAIARITVEVHPDDYYERLYARELGGKLPADQRALYVAAAKAAASSRFIAEERDVPIAQSSKP